MVGRVAAGLTSPGALDALGAAAAARHSGRRRHRPAAAGGGAAATRRPSAPPAPRLAAAPRRAPPAPPRARPDGAPAPSLDDDEAAALLEALEVDEPAAEARAEGAAATVAAAVLFGAGVWAALGRAKGEEYFAGYLLEQSLSVDNLFVFILVFDYFKTPPALQGKVLTVGIATAAALRLALIVVGVDIVERFRPVLLVFAGILLYSSVRLLLERGGDDEGEDLGGNRVVQLVRRLVRVSDSYDGDAFFTRGADGAWLATPLLLVLLVVEISDVVFAVDSIPAVFGVTLDPFIVYSSNVFAILSLRGLYAFVATTMSKMRFLDKSVALVLGFVGAKIVLEFAGVKVPTDAALGVVAALLAAGVGASLAFPEPGEE